MTRRPSNATINQLALASVLFLCLAGCFGNKLGPNAIKGRAPDGYVDMQAVQAAYIGSGTAGSGTLNFHGRDYPFDVGGLGVGGIGLSSIDAQGEVYGLPDLAQFPGTYGQARYGFAIGSTSAGDLWMQNEFGVILHLKAKRTGLILSLGGDAVVISMN